MKRGKFEVAERLLMYAIVSLMVYIAFVKGTK